MEDTITAAIQESIADLPDADVPEGTPEPDVPETPAPAAEGTPPPAEDPKAAEEREIAEILRELREKNPDMARGRMPLDRHQAVLTKQRREAEKKVADYETKLAEATAKAQQYDTPEWRDKLAALDLATTNPRAFARLLPTLNPEYAQFVRDEAPAAVARAEAAQPAAAELGPKPEPDRVNSDGTPGYSPERHDALIAWHVAKAQQEILGRVAPVLQEREEKEVAQAAYGRQSQILDQAERTWPGFKENFEAIRGIFLSDKSLTLEGAYARFNAQEATRLQAEIKRLGDEVPTVEARGYKKALDEVTARSKGAAASHLRPGTLPAAEAPDPNAPVDLEDVIREAIRPLKNAA